METRFFHTNFEGEYVEHLHKLARAGRRGRDSTRALGRHYSWAIHDALETAALPAVEVHLSDVKAREPWRRVSVVEDLCVGAIFGQGAEGYRLALAAAARASSTGADA